MSICGTMSRVHFREENSANWTNCGMQTWSLKQHFHGPLPHASKIYTKVISKCFEEQRLTNTVTPSVNWRSKNWLSLYNDTWFALPLMMCQWNSIKTTTTHCLKTNTDIQFHLLGIILALYIRHFELHIFNCVYPNKTLHHLC